MQCTAELKIPDDSKVILSIEMSTKEAKEMLKEISQTTNLGELYYLKQILREATTNLIGQSERHMKAPL